MLQTPSHRQEVNTISVCSFGVPRLQETSGPHVAIVHNGRLVPSALSLNTVKRYLDGGKARDDLRLHYTLIDWRAPPPIAEVVPQDIPVE